VLRGRVWEFTDSLLSISSSLNPWGYGPSFLRNIAINSIFRGLICSDFLTELELLKSLTHFLIIPTSRSRIRV